MILCIGRFSDLPKSPKFSINQGPEVFGGEVLHSMDYAALDDNCAVNFTKDKKVVVVGFQKSAVDIASEISMRNGNPETSHDHMIKLSKENIFLFINNKGS